MIQQQLSRPKLLMPKKYTPPHAPAPQRRLLSDFWAAPPVPQCLFLVPLAPQEDLWIEAFHDLTDGEALSPVKVSAPFFIWDKIVASFYLLFRQ